MHLEFDTTTPGKVQPPQDHWATLRSADWYIPLRLVFFVAVCLFVEELTVFSIESVLVLEPWYIETIVETALNILLLSPVLYFFLLLPIRRQFIILERTKKELDAALSELQAMYDEMERRVQERTADLGQANTALLEEISIRKQAEKHLQQRNLELQELNANSEALNRSLNRDDLLKQVRNFFKQEAGISSGALYLSTASQANYVMELAWGDPLDEQFLNELHQQTCKQQKAILVPLNGKSPKGTLQCAAFPLIYQGHILGVLDLVIPASQRLKADRIPFFEAIGNQIAAAVKNADLYQAETDARKTAETLQTASLALTQSLDIKQVMEILSDTVEANLPVDGIVVFLSSDPTHLVAQSFCGSKYSELDQADGGLQISLEEYPILQEILSTRDVAYLPDTLQEPRWKSFFGKTDTRSWLGVPILGGDQVIGICGLENQELNAFSEKHITMSKALAGQAAVAVHNAWLFDQVRTGRERLRSLSNRLIETQEMERRYIARELHDETSQALIYLKFALELLKGDVNDPDKVTKGIAEVDRVVGEVLDDLHRLAADLRPASLDLLGLAPALRQFVEKLSAKYNLKVSLDFVNLEKRLPSQIEIQFFRMVQEAIANTVRHAQATEASVVIAHGPAKVSALITDNGIGFNWNEALQKGRMGLYGMRERAEMLGGSLQVETSIGGGTKIYIEVPYVDPNPDR